MTITHKFTLGQRVRCLVTNYEGTLTARVEHLNGCVQYCVKPEVDPEKPRERPDGHYIDEEQLEYLDEGYLAGQDRKDVVTSDQVEASKFGAGGPSHREGELPT